MLRLRGKIDLKSTDYCFESGAFPTSPCLSAPMERRGERVEIEFNRTGRCFDSSMESGLLPSYAETLLALGRNR
jgi:hypothetical protein